MNEIRDLRGERPLPLPSRQSDEGFHTLSSSVRVESAARSHRGSRLTNEDHYLVLRISRHHETIASSLPDGEVPARFEESGYGMVVADGMGGTGSGEAASRLAISTLVHLALHFGKWNVRVTPRIADEIIERGLRFYRSVDEHVTEAGLTSPWLAGMGTTLTAAYVADDALFVLHVGHSRAYLLRDGRLTQLTRDQTLAQRLETGTPGPIELASHDLSHLLTDAIGGLAGSPSIQVGHFRLQHGDCVLLCTNGLTDVVDDDSSQAILLQPGSLDERCQALVDLALARGGEDNITAIIATYTVPGGVVRGSVTHL